MSHRLPGPTAWVEKADWSGSSLGRAQGAAQEVEAWEAFAEKRGRRGVCRGGLDPPAFVSALARWGRIAQGWEGGVWSSSELGEARCHPALGRAALRGWRAGAAQTRSPSCLPVGFSHSFPDIAPFPLLLGLPVFVRVRTFKIRECFRGAQAGAGLCQGELCSPGLSLGITRKRG